MVEELMVGWGSKSRATVHGHTLSFNSKHSTHALHLRTHCTQVNLSEPRAQLLPSFWGNSPRRQKGSSGATFSF